jgi:mRNA-degrading endonuclease toxin of MazEF toxin-antitoxin module
MSKKSKTRRSSPSKSSGSGKRGALRRRQSDAPQAQGTVVWLRWDYVEGGGKGDEHPALVLSTTEFNDAYKFGILALISTEFSDPPGVGEYPIKYRTGTGLTKECAVVPVIQSAAWLRMEKIGELTPYEFKAALAKLQEVYA